MSLLSTSKKNRRSILRTCAVTVKLPVIVWVIVACALLIISVACGQSSAIQKNHSVTSTQMTADPSPIKMIYLVTFASPTTYTQAHELLKRLGLSVGQWKCMPRAEQGGMSVSYASVLLLLTTPPPSQDTPDFYGRTHELIVGYWETPNPRQLAQLESSPQVVSLQAIPLVSC